ncbi:transcriptional regulator [Ramlibacter sp. Leaf400]|uniref:transcriptional regulator n=1 Tax=Ramlibacter sp. Leaf400 TaxID=1736365 RepID=UPI0006FB71ED|nr:transcriptional regulator [Ramlibacter sp. Leaf400]KQT11658.1 transcriptional regulator [Ramlibacter sp. Leaf400]
MQTQLSGPPPTAGLALRLLGPLSVSRGGTPVALPPSRKVRALLAYLAVAGRTTTRSHLCELLWDLPSDPRGELRWCLSKLRSVLDEPGRQRVLADGEGVSLDLSDCSVDVLEVAHALRDGFANLAAADLQALAARFGDNDLLEGLDLPRSPAFSGWLIAERRRLRATHAAVLEHWVQALPPGSDTALAALEHWLAIAPFDRRAHEGLLEALASRGRLREGEEHLAATARQYEAEGQDWAPIGHAWRAAKSRAARHPREADDRPSLSGHPRETDDRPPPSRHSREGGNPVLPLPFSLDLRAAPGPRLRGDDEAPTPLPRRASLAVMPFIDRTPGVALRGGLGDGMAHDVITRLAKLRSMFVIAEGTMFALSERRVDSQDAGRRLDVDYVASGSIRRGADARLTVTVQLAETRTAQVVWAEEFSGRLDDTFAVLDEIGNRIVSSIARQIEVAERNRAILKNPNSLDAWEAHHRGLWHMVRFNREDNEQARHFFQTAVRLDPTFARPHAGLSFTHFQDAFLGWRERDAAIERAYGAAADGVMADERDPASHWALGRAMWLRDRQDETLGELHSAIELSPNFALGHYTLAFVHMQSGDPRTAIAEADHARALSPMDPLLFGMLASRAIALARLGQYEEAADWAVRSAARPNAHVHIRAISMVCLALAGRVQEAKDVAAAIRQSQSGYGVADFLQAFKLGAEAESLVRKAARLIDA